MNQQTSANIRSPILVHFTLVLHCGLDFMPHHVQHSVLANDVPTNADFVHHQLMYQQKVRRVDARCCMARDSQLSQV